MALISSKKSSGMTLLELLIAMTLMVIISGIAYASLNGLIDAKILTDSVAKNLRQELLTSQQINKDFHAFINRSSKDELGQRSDAIQGNFSSILFNRNGHANPLNKNRSELQKVQWFVRENSLYRRSLDMLDSGSFPNWQERKYLDKVDTLNINYTNLAGQQSRNWPIPNGQLPIKNIQLSIIMQDETVFKYFLVPLL
ncbi:MAG: type II secretion system protein J [Marinicellaceae bacterium]